MSDIVEQRGRWRTPRTRGGIVGIGLMLLAPGVRSFRSSGRTSTTPTLRTRPGSWTAARGYLEVLPGAAASLAGLILVVTAHRATASLADGSA